MFRFAVSLLVSASLLGASIGCTSDRVMARPTAGTIVEKVRVGDFVSVGAKNGKTYSIEVVEVGDSYLRGTDPETGKRYRIPFSQIQVMTYEAYDGVKTAVATGVGVYAALIAGAILLFATIGDSFGDSWDGGGGC